MDELQVITGTYKKEFIDDILTKMELVLNNSQLIELNKSLNKHTNNLIISENVGPLDLDYDKTNHKLIEDFIKTKRLKGLSLKSLQYYESQLNRLESWAVKSFIEMNSEDLKEYLVFYHELNNCSKTTLNNTRRILSSFWRWMEIEEKIIINPMKRIPSIKVPKKVRKAFGDEEIELLRNGLKNSIHPLRDTAIFELLLSSGLRLSEIKELKKKDISLVDCKGICLGKGNKQRVFYFSERCKVAIIEYLDSRVDDNDWLFVEKNNPYNKFAGGGIGAMIRELGRNVGVDKTHPHRFRRTLASRLVRKGMPLDQVSKILGHESLSVTMRYVETDKELLKLVHSKHTN